MRNINTGKMEMMKKTISIENLIKKQSAKRKFKKSLKKKALKIENILTVYI